jgi:hypothetical protein
MDVQVAESVRFREEHEVRLGAAGRVVQRARQGVEQCAERRGFLGGQLVHRRHVPAGEHDEPSRQRAVERVRNAPGIVGVDPFTVGDRHWIRGEASVVVARHTCIGHGHAV